MKYLLLIVSVFLLQTELVFSQRSADSVLLNEASERVKSLIPETLVNQAKEEEKPKEAIALYKKALAAKTDAYSPNWEADIRLAIAKLLLKTSESKGAFEQLLSAQEIFTQTANTQGQLDVMIEMAHHYESIKDFKEAERYLQLVLDLQESVGFTSASPDIYYRLANILLKKQDYDRSLKYIVSAANEFELNNEKEKMAQSYLLQAEIKRRQKGFTESEQLLLKRALPAFSSIESQEGRIACFNMLGQMYYDQRRFSEAKWFYIQSNTHYRALKDDVGTVNSLVNLAKVKSAIGDNKSSLKDFKEAEALAKKKKNTALVASVKSAYAKYYNKKIKAAPVPKVVKANTPAKRPVTTAKEAKAVIAEN